jgi:hypothetical protein
MSPHFPIHSKGHSDTPRQHNRIEFVGPAFNVMYPRLSIRGRLRGPRK